MQTTVVANPAPVTTNWGPYFSSDHRSKAQGTVTVDHRVKKVVFWKKWWGWDKHHHKVWHKKKFVKFVKFDVFTVKSTLWNFGRHDDHGKKGDHRHGRFDRFLRCAWETFKVEDKAGHVSFQSFYNCDRSSKDFEFTTVNSVKISVDVSRGNSHRPLAKHSGFNVIYPVM
ncbi:hypothetical protein J5X84_35400 [Streptosporangiaceae bacterium NEAU-GS5]|nr:hypothetical protein [Streptosporangiaceae bacterium NEAU-GS5]